MTPTPTPTATESPSSTSAPLSLIAVRALPIGSKVRTTGVEVAEAGRLGTPALLAIGSADAGLVVRLPADAPTIARGAMLDVSGTLAAPYGQLEIRPAKSKKKYIILGLIGGAAVGGIVAATHGGGGGGGGAAAPPTGLSPGGVTVGGPR
jgi:hypothetical protein